MEPNKNRFALITGASKGIGRAVSFALAQAGYSIIICARNIKKLEEFQRWLSETCPTAEVLVHACDFAIPEQRAELLNWLDQQQVHIEVLVNNVGRFEPRSLFDEAPDTLEQHMQVNLFTAYQLSVHLARHMRARKQGHIFNISSVASRQPIASAAAYTVTKYALAGLTAVLREELRTSGVKVTEIIPGSTMTASWEGTSVPASEFVLPEDIADAVLSILKMSEGANVDEIFIRPLKGQV
jgi:3-oxoacyl-[acyl-carrier protein] reductase